MARRLAAQAVAIGGMAFATMAPAQDRAVDEAIVAACFDTAPRGGITTDCIGLAARLCEDADRPTTVGTMSCTMAETAAWDAILNREYKATRDQFADMPGLSDTLLTAQRAWIALRDADCKFAYDRYDGGSMRSVAAGFCQMEHTARRALELKKMRGY
ncbi:lysozyme inhibitor LprI family protein [Paracoccus spongiarum]|uniref:Lysozyme inhibitor LprI family protein n=1 Tax=Paracoccus spongiarum TaxID=3064387 RepID=A0ABT9J7L7_9RHOB|nr:lysozyme inhibitor LprI family protein [Paracoccus sp. 2205BS29-5]MDP5305720.1 lysozyme inhibitor LprI family protein [Paracoccus sp. 2205BS29-5]